jgi:enterochelin esterase family protein
VGPIEPDIYFYNFNIDGVQMLDPANPNAKIGFTTSTITSILEIRADQPGPFWHLLLPERRCLLDLWPSKK